MKNEYLFLSDEHRDAIEKYKPNGVNVEITAIEKTVLWITSYTVDGENYKNANKLSDVHLHIMEYSPRVLSCESSEYYNRALFPFINTLERKLRKLLYLAAAISNDKKANENVKQLEEKDFGDIFNILFIDQSFIDNMKKRINAAQNSGFEKQQRYCKKDIKNYLDSLVEHTLWEDILKEKDVPTLRNRFRDVQDYRNSVMHAHNICKEQFNKARDLFRVINSELEVSIARFISESKGSFAEPDTIVDTAISKALEDMAIPRYNDIMTKLLKEYTVMSDPAMIESIKTMYAIYSNPVVMDLINMQNKYSNLLNLWNKQYQEEMKMSDILYRHLNPMNSGTSATNSEDLEYGNIDEKGIRTENYEDNHEEEKPNV